MRSVLTIGVVLALILALFVVGEFVQRTVAYRVERAALVGGDETEGVPPVEPAAFTDPLRHMARNAYQRIPRPGEEAALERGLLPVYRLRISPKNRRLLEKTAEAVTARSISTGITRDYVPAKFQVDGEWVGVDVKLRGLTDLHHMPARPSLRIKFPKHRLFHGKKQINISDPYDKGLTADIVTAAELARQGLVTWESGFVILEVNGEVVGLFQEIEQFGRSMIDAAGRTEGFIFSGNGQLFGKPEGFGWDKADVALQWFLRCRDQGAAPADQGPCNWESVRENLDTDKFARAAAMTALVGSGHAWYGDNLRLYFDPARGKLEPIPWDYNFYRMTPETNVSGEPSSAGYAGAFLRIPELRRLRDERLWELVTERVEPMLASADSLFEKLSGLLALDDRRPGTAKDLTYHAKFADALRANAQTLRELYESRDLTVRAIGNGAGRTLEVENRAKSHFAVAEVITSSGRGAVEPPLVVDGTWLGETRVARREIGPVRDAASLRVLVRNLVTNEAFETAVQIVEGPSPEVADDRRGPEPAPVFPDVVRVEGKTLSLGGTVRLDRTLVVPSGWNLRLEPGLDLRLGTHASILSYGEVEAKGTRERPITVHGSVAVQGRSDAPVRVHLEHVTIHGGSGTESERVRFTGALAVTDGVVTLRHCAFLDGRADDGINLKYCRIALEDNLFAGSADDAVDLDFCTGDVIGNTVHDAGGDGLDCSGSRVLIEGNTIRNCADKGMSIGEHTLAEIVDNLVTGCRVGVASKDESVTTIRSTALADLDIGVALYVKKPTFGPSRARLHGVAMWNVETAFLRGAGTELEVAESARYVPGNGTAHEEQLVTVRVDASASLRDSRDLLTWDEAEDRRWGIRTPGRIDWPSSR